MAEMMAAMTAMAAAATATATSAAAAVGTAATAAGSTLSFLSVASTVAGGLAAMYSANQEASALEGQAQDAEFRATQDTINGKQDALNALRDLNNEQAKIVAAGYASGIGGEGSTAAAFEASQKVGDQNYNQSRENARYQSAARRSQARQYRSSARGARTGGVFKAVSGGLSLFARREARG